MIIKEKAKQTLQKAYDVALQCQNAPVCSHKDFIDFVIDSNHLTFKYVLFTAILSKATDPTINALCLQAKSQLPGAYDARTVCHKVIVPFEMDTLQKALGGSNEPFLNKPARFTELDKSNAVRRGRDQSVLNSLCDNLPRIKTQKDATQCLVYLIYKLISIRDMKNSLTTFSVPESANLPSKLMEFIDRAIENSFEGEVLTLLVSGVYYLRFRKLNSIVEVHPVNESGASGREISDLDVYVNGTLISSNELKDKDYAETDVRHAADKVLKAGGTKMLFIEGPRAKPQGEFVDEVQHEYMNKNFLLRIIRYHYFFAANVGSIEDCDCEEFVRFILQKARDTKFKEEVITYLDKLAQEIFGLTR